MARLIITIEADIDIEYIQAVDHAPHAPVAHTRTVAREIAETLFHEDLASLFLDAKINAVLDGTTILEETVDTWTGQQ